MKVFSLTIVLLLTWGTSALAFENIEADAAYQKVIQGQIRKEFSDVMKMLKALADGLGVAVREKDVDAVKQHIYAKAFLMGDCVDRAATSKKNGSNENQNIEQCIEASAKFLRWIENPEPPVQGLLAELSACRFSNILPAKDPPPPYEFLKDAPQHDPRLDFLLDTEFREAAKALQDRRRSVKLLTLPNYPAMKQCYESEAIRIGAERRLAAVLERRSAPVEREKRPGEPCFSRGVSHYECFVDVCLGSLGRSCKEREICEALSRPGYPRPDTCAAIAR